MANSNPFFLDQVLFIVLPYLSFALFLLISIRRYLRETFTFSSLSSQFLENKQHFWGLVPFHYGMITILSGHLIGFLLPREVLWWNSIPLRLYVLELTAFIAAILTLTGLINIIVRRLSIIKMKMVTSFADWILFGIFILQILTGLYTAIFHSWGSSWFTVTAVPYLFSLFLLSPDISFVTAMPWMVKIHIISAYLMIAFFPFTRLVHALVVPNPYLWRKPQVVRWYAKWSNVRHVQR